ncbi:hypothetical protein GOB92_31740 [Sinorhizobium meliloti]|nr:hypothetical protein [Sinorhizobium meliloti]
MFNDTRAPARSSVAAIASFTEATSGSAVGLPEDRSVATFVMNQTLRKARARGVLRAINVTRICAADCSDTRWFEIDSEGDLSLAEEIFALPPTLSFSNTQSMTLASGGRR